MFFLHEWQVKQGLVIPDYDFRAQIEMAPRSAKKTEQLGRFLARAGRHNVLVKQRHRLLGDG
ncbi:hypothetical protein HMPREF2891_03285 [Actinomyces sp. HMSC065F11]|nr:hypothetical protein HMPREF2891_03285 [Actinomyces sp. HMSC065F11]